MSESRISRAIAACLLGAGGFGIFGLNASFGQETAVSTSPRPSHRHATSSRAAIKVNVEVILVPVTVVDSLQHPVTDLPPGSFKLYEDKVEQEVTGFGTEDGPVSVGFIVDSSRSMKKRMEDSMAAVRQFLGTAIPGDEFFLLEFSDTPHFITGFTGIPEEISAGLPRLRPDGWTALNDAIYLGVQTMKRARNVRKAVIVLTDGSDNRSRYSDSELRNLIQESDVRVYSVGLFTRPELPARLASVSGGRAFWVRKMADLPGVIEQLSRVLRNEYVLAYTPRNRAADGKYRKIQVKVVSDSRRNPLHVSWRRGYYPPVD